MTAPSSDPGGAPPPDGLVLVDKPGGWTSHDVVARVRRLAGTRRVGHAGTLDPMATGVLVLGVGRATRLLGHLALHDKEYAATIRLGAATTTDDAEGAAVAAAAPELLRQVTDAAIAAGLAGLSGVAEQVPPQVSAVKVAGRRSYQRARAGETVELAPRRVTISRLDLLAVRRSAAAIEADVEVECSSGTYVRAIARDLGAVLGCGGHLGALRRTRVGGYSLAATATLDQLADDLRVVPLADAVAAAFPRLDVAADVARAVANGARLAPDVLESAGHAPGGPFGVFGPDGAVLALVELREGALRPLCVFPP